MATSVERATTWLSTSAAELGSAIIALALSPAVAAILVGGGAVQIHGSNAAAFFDSVFLGPILGLVGAWLDTRRGQGFGLMLVGLGALLALDGVFATYFVSAPLLVLLALSFASALLRRQRPDRSGRLEG